MLELSGISIKNDLLVSVIPEKPDGVGYIVFKRITLRTEGSGLSKQRTGDDAR